VRKILEQNEAAEKMNRTLLEKVRYMLSNAGLSKSFWAEALSYACHLINRLPSSAIKSKALLKVWSENIAQDCDSLQIFGCLAYYHIKKDKLGLRARKGLFMCFKKDVKGYKF